MTRDEILGFLTSLLKNVNAVDPDASGSEIDKIKLPDLAWFEMQLDADPDFKKDALFRLVVEGFKEEFNGIEPVIVPFDGRVFDRDITVGQLASEIANDT